MAKKATSSEITAPKEIRELVEKFTEHSESYKRAGYNETLLRRDFLDPFFEVLGWDMTNRQGYAEAYRDVIHEDALRVEKAARAPDYCFRIGGTRKFFVEAKKPAVDIKTDVSPAFQLRRYAWTAKLPLSILTDFEEFAVYDCRKRPDKSDKASEARILLLNYTDYLTRWDEIADVFSREAILKGSFDKFAESTKKKRGTAPVDEEFLKEIDQWREELAKNLSLRNESLTDRQLNVAVGRIIDRIIFLRMCEGRGIEEYGRLLTLLNGERVYRRLVELFYRADEKYNSGLFHFQSERGREQPDELTPDLKLDDKVLKDIIRRLYYPESPYEFAAMPAEILGQVYEQFLGKVIRLTAGHRAKIEEKPEVRKAGGVFYTPTYIVDYIVENTVGKLLEGKTPQEVGGLTATFKPAKNARPISILDPACGSGSFLLVAYQYLLDWYLKQYTEVDDPKHHARGANPRIYQTPTGDWRLTIAERKRILLAHIYGVDIDYQAVEVTKLSLLLKVLEKETEATIQRELFAKQRALPDLAENIKCGNSLIGPDFYDGQQRELFTDEDRLRINAFDWQGKHGFPKIFAGENPGFDVVIGNPPYIPIETMTPEEREYFQSHYSQLERKYDSSIIFILAGLAKLNTNGRLSYISTLTWQTGENFVALRRYIFESCGLDSVIHLPFDVFKDAYVDTGVYVLTKMPTDAYSIYRFPKKERCTDLSVVKFMRVETRLIGAPAFKIVLNPVATEILARCKRDDRHAEFGSFTESTQGLAGNRYDQHERQPRGATWYPFFSSGQIYRYAVECGHTTYVDMVDHLSLRKFYDAVPKILIRRVINRQDRLMATYYERAMVFKKDVNPFVVVDSAWDPYFVLSVINSRLISFLYVNTSSIATKDDFRQTTLAELRQLPIPHENSQKSTSLSGQARRMIELSVRLAEVRTDHERTALQHQIDHTDRQIDALVYELYGLSDKEIQLVEDSTK